MNRVPVLLPLPLTGPYDYAVPDSLTVTPGMIVAVPLGTRHSVGVVWLSSDPAPESVVPAAKLRPIDRILDLPNLPMVSLAFADWVADYTMAPRGAVLKMILPHYRDYLKETDPRPHWILRDDLSPDPWAGMATAATPHRRKAVLALRGVPPASLSALARMAGVGHSVVKSLVDLGLLRPAAAMADPIPRPDPDFDAGTLTPPQQAIAAALAQQVARHDYHVSVLDGVTGSGKTLVYFEAIAESLRQGRQALILLPEIALGPQWLDRFSKRFGCLPAVWHSDLSPPERRRTFKAIQHGTAPVVVGARSALFLPYPNLGVIIVDEEHDAAYKQDDGVAYQARDLAVLRGKLDKTPVILASATPSLETWYNIQHGRYRRFHLPERFGGAALPLTGCIDLRRDPPPRQSFLSPPLRQALGENLAAGEQSLLFLNRRGYAPLTLCRGCGYRLPCPSCSAWLVEHRLLGKVQCHHCGYSAPLPRICPQCHAVDNMVACGPGVERIAEETAALFPAARIAILTSDTLSGPKNIAAMIDRIQAGAVDLLIGTQIVAKGHHFPDLTLVGVVDADLGLAGGDLRAAERTFQLLQQVAGRAGRAARKGRVLLQTYEPDNAVLQALLRHDRDGFVRQEQAWREAAQMPPFGRLAALILSAASEPAVDRAAQEFAKVIPMHDGVTVFGPAPAPMAKLRGRHRRRFLIKTARDILPQPMIRRWLAACHVPGHVQVKIDIDPYNFL